jgi:lysozyme
MGRVVNHLHQQEAIMATTMSDRGIADLVADEGEVLTAYRCPAGVLTIGVGLTKGSGVVDPKPGMTISRGESRRLLKLALGRNYEPRVNRRLPGAKQNEFDGATSFDFNTGRIHNASWVDRFKAGEVRAAEASFKSWNKGGGRVLAGLTKRREREWRTIRDGVYHSTAMTTPPSLTDPAEIWPRLKALGFNQPTAAGAVLAFQQRHGLKVDGLVGPATRSTLVRAEEAKRAGQTTVGGGAAGGAAGGGAELTTDPNVTLDTALSIGVGAVVVAGIILTGWLVWKYRGPLFARVPEPVKDWFADRGIVIGRRVAA